MTFRLRSTVYNLPSSFAHQHTNRHHALVEQIGHIATIVSCLAIPYFFLFLITN